ncbi:hypothetical protein [Nonomuraea indica]|uniref:hypothetical protein n=1 Tax=Nonomuraea indica TaxID=1581193 RepID=UPI000C7A8FAF|nr:hypothetical protein [Nonomuraea indica]
MGTRLKTDWGRLARSGEDVGMAHGRALAEFRDFQARMASCGVPWGVNNQLGQAIGACYAAIAAIHASCLEQNLATYTGYPHGMRQMAATGRAAEEATAKDLQSLRAEGEAS